MSISIYEKMWNTLKAESGYRNTINQVSEILGKPELNSTLRELMEAIEERAIKFGELDRTPE